MRTNDTKGDDEAPMRSSPISYRVESFEMTAAAPYRSKRARVRSAASASDENACTAPGFLDIWRR